MPHNPVGPLARSTATLTAALAVTGLPVSMTHPASFYGAGLGAWPLAVLPESLPGQAGSPLRVRVRFLVYAATPDDLDAVLMAGLAYLAPEGIADAIWGALGVPHQLAVLCDVPVQMALPAPEAPRVTRLPELTTVSLRGLTGSVVTSDGVPLVGMRVAVADGTTSTSTDTRGRFALAGVIADQPVKLLVTGRGLRLVAEVTAASAEPVVITCEI